MMRLQVMITAFAALFVALSVHLEGDAGARAFQHNARFSLLGAADSALVAAERATWSRPQIAGPDGDPVEEAAAAPQQCCGDVAILSWHATSVARPYHEPVVLSPARGPPTHTA